jgi:hypothetical protein
MFFIARNKHRFSGLEGVPLPLAKNLAGPSMDEHFMFPCMGMPGRMSPGGNLKDPHTKVWGPVFLADHHPGGDAFGWVAIEVSSFHFRILFNYHEYPPAAKNFS